MIWIDEHEGAIGTHPLDARRERLDTDLVKARRHLTLMRASLHHNAGGRMVMGFYADHVARLERRRDTLDRTMTGGKQ